MARLFGKKLAYLRRQRKTTQTALAHQLSLASHAHISHLEAGRKAPSLDLVLRIAYLLGVSTDYLLRDTISIEAPTQFDAVAEAHSGTLPQLFGAKVRELRTRQGLTQADLSERLGLRTQAHISLLESGRSEASTTLVVQLADIFGVTTDYLLRDSLPLALEQDAAEALEE